MRFTDLLLKRTCNRWPLNPDEIKKIKFQELYKLELQNKITEKLDKEADISCLEEMAIMFACMKKHDFKEVKCSPEIETFNKCYERYTTTKELKKQRERSGEITIGTNARKLTIKQMNQLLAKHPQHNKQF